MWGRSSGIVSVLLSLIHLFGLYIAVTNSQAVRGRIQWTGGIVDVRNLQPNSSAAISGSAAALTTAATTTTPTPPLTSNTTPQPTTPIGITVPPRRNRLPARLLLSKSSLSRILANIFGKISESSLTSPSPTTEALSPIVTTPMRTLNGEQIEKILLSLNKNTSTHLSPGQNSLTTIASRPQHVSTTDAFMQRNNPVYASKTTTPTVAEAILIPTLAESTLEFIAQGLVNHPQGAQPLSDASLSAKVNSNGPSFGVTELYPDTTRSYQSTYSASSTAFIPFERRILPPSILDLIAKGLLRPPPKSTTTENTPTARTSDTRGTLNRATLPIGPNPNNAEPLGDGSLTGNSGTDNFPVIQDPFSSSGTTTTTPNKIPTTTPSPVQSNRPTNLYIELTTAVASVQVPTQQTDKVILNHKQSLDTPLNDKQVHSTSLPTTTSQTVLPSSPNTIEPSILDLIAKGLLSKPSLSSAPDATSAPDIADSRTISTRPLVTKRANLTATQRSVPTPTYSPTPVFRLPPDPIKLLPGNQLPTDPLLTASEAPGISDSPQIQINSEFGQSFTTDSIQLVDESGDPSPTFRHRLPKLRRPIPVEKTSGARPKIIRTEATDQFSPVTESNLPAKSHANRNCCFGALLFTFPLYLWIWSLL